MSTSRLAALADTPLFPLAVVIQILPQALGRRNAGLLGGHNEGTAVCRPRSCPHHARMNEVIATIEAARHAARVKDPRMAQ